MRNGDEIDIPAKAVEWSEEDGLWEALTGSDNEEDLSEVACNGLVIKGLAGK